MHIIKRQDITTYYYAGSNISAENVWTTNATLATRFRERQAALTLERAVAERTRLPGRYSIVELQVQQFGAEVNAVPLGSKEWEVLNANLLMQDRDMY